MNKTKSNNIKWHELNVGDTINFRRTKEGDTLIAKVLSFRKVMAIVLCDNGQYELLELGEFNSFYSAKLALAT